MNSSLDRVRARARLLLAADNWRELSQLLERDVPALIAEVEQLPVSWSKPSEATIGTAPSPRRVLRLPAGVLAKAD